MSPKGSQCTAFGDLRWPAKVNALGLCAAVAALAYLLWPQWRHDEDMSHGIFLPILAVILVFESRRDAHPRFLQPGAGPVIACALLILISLGGVAAAIIYAAALGWTHTMVEFILSASLASAAAAAWLGFADWRVRFVPLNWAAAVAVGLWPFASPPPPGTYSRLALFLQGEVTGAVVRVLNAVRIAAYQDGNVIELARASVGVSEACSGVRSLMSCAVAGLFLSAVLVRKPWHRLLVIAVSPAIGLAMNFLRSLLLTLLVNRGIRIEGRWHDLTGASIIIVATLLVTAFAFWLHRREPEPVEGPAAAAAVATGRSPLLGMVTATLLIATGTADALAMASHPLGRATIPVANLAVLLPGASPGWTAQRMPDLDQYSAILQTHSLVEQSYATGTAPGSARITLYLAYWRPGEAPVSLVDAHTPDACWPGTGWEPKALPRDRSPLRVGKRIVAPAECRLFVHNNLETRVWFWHLYGGRPIAFVDPYSAVRLLGLSLRYGVGPAEDQLFVRISSNRPWQEISMQPFIRDFFANLKPLGL
jgi:exosortase